jgi:SAM-dependent methyltransferase
MPIKSFIYQGVNYPELQKEGFASQYIFPFAQKVCKGVGYDVGYSREEWKFPGAIGIDVNEKNDYDADNLPNDREVDYIFSSHCLEHVPNWVNTLDHWISKLKDGGVLFLYLPDKSQKYWLPWNNRKHNHILDPSQIKEYLEHKGMKNIFVSGVDFNSSFAVMAEK